MTTRNSFMTCLGCLTIVVGLWIVLSREQHEPANRPHPLDESKDDEELKGPPLFEDVTERSKILARYDNGEDKGHLSILESLGGGVGVVDYDGDGLLDVFFPGGGTFEKTDSQLGPRQGKGQPTPTGRACKILGRPCKLYRNLGDWEFEDVSERVLRIEGEWPFSHGVAVADYDCDGHPDLLVTGWDRVVLFHNEADPADSSKRRLVDVTVKMGLTHRGWSSSAGWGDLDGDGFPDLFVLNYVDWSFANHPVCDYDGRTPDVCAPRLFAGLPDRLYLNRGGKSFMDVSEEAGLAKGGEKTDKGLGVLLVDLNLDGKPEVYVCNDTVDNYLYVNQSKPGQIRLLDRGFESLTARDERGTANGSMGVDAGDYDGRGLPSLFVTNFENEKHALYRNDWKPGDTPDRHFFTHRSNASRVAAIGQTFVSWGNGFLDVQNRGREDLVIVSGHILRHPTTPGVTREQRPVLLSNQGDGTFKDLSRRGGDYFTRGWNARGLALADLDNDGRVDLVVNHINAQASVVRNISPTTNHWLGVELRSRDHRDLVGARVSLTAGGLTQWRFVKGGGSYASARDPRLVFGLGDIKQVQRLTVHWPDGSRQHFNGLSVDRYHPLTRDDSSP